MSKTTKSYDVITKIATLVFEELNLGRVKIVDDYQSEGLVIITDVEPKYLVYPKWWYYAAGVFRNKQNNTTGFYCEVTMIKTDDTLWGNIAKYFAM